MKIIKNIYQIPRDCCCWVKLNIVLCSQVLISICVFVYMCMLGHVPSSVFWQWASQIRAFVEIFISGCNKRGSSMNHGFLAASHFRGYLDSHNSFRHYSSEGHRSADIRFLFFCYWEMPTHLLDGRGFTGIRGWAKLKLLHNRQCTEFKNQSLPHLVKVIQKVCCSLTYWSILTTLAACHVAEKVTKSSKRAEEHQLRM